MPKAFDKGRVVWYNSSHVGGDGGIQMNKPRISYEPIYKLKRMKGNPKGHDLDFIEGSIGRFGFISPMILDEGTGRLVAGHGRLKVLERMKAEGKPAPVGINVGTKDWEAPVVRGIRFRDRAEAEAYLLADNRAMELGGWEEDKLLDFLGKLAEQDPDAPEEAGWSREEIMEIRTTMELQAEDMPDWEDAESDETDEAYQKAVVRQLSIYLTQGEYEKLIAALDEVPIGVTGLTAEAATLADKFRARDYSVVADRLIKLADNVGVDTYTEAILWLLEFWQEHKNTPE